MGKYQLIDDEYQKHIGVPFVEVMNNNCWQVEKNLVILNTKQHYMAACEYLNHHAIFFTRAYWIHPL